MKYQLQNGNKKEEKDVLSPFRFVCVVSEDCYSFIFQSEPLFLTSFEMITATEQHSNESFLPARTGEVGLW